MEVIPRQLCDNAGFDATNILNKLRQKHAQGHPWYGVDILNEDIADNYEVNVFKCIYKSEIKSILPCRVLKLSKRLLYSCYSFQKCVWEPAVVKINAITAASEAACLILSVDETVKNPRSGQGEGGMPPGGGMPMGGMGRGRGRPM